MNYGLVFNGVFSNFDRKYLPAYPQISALYRYYFVLAWLLITEILGHSLLNWRNKTKNSCFTTLNSFSGENFVCFKWFFQHVWPRICAMTSPNFSIISYYFVLHRLLNTEMLDQIGENTRNYRFLLHWTAMQISDEKVSHFQRFCQKVWPKVWGITSPNFSIIM